MNPGLGPFEREPGKHSWEVAFGCVEMLFASAYGFENEG